jgi:hypothetical protein
MFVYNISFQIDPNQQAPWLIWMQEKFIPMIHATACFSDNKFYEIEVSEDQAPTYTLQLFYQTPENIEKYKNQLSESIMAELQDTWGNQCFHFITTMRIVN